MRAAGQKVEQGLLFDCFTTGNSCDHELLELAARQAADQQRRSGCLSDGLVSRHAARLFWVFYFGCENASLWKKGSHVATFFSPPN
jgi:hypothetical protein